MVKSRQKKQLALGHLPQSKYYVILSSLRGNFKIPVTERTTEQRQVLCLIRRRGDFTLDDKGRLLCHGKIVIPAEQLTSEVKRFFRKSHGCGPRTLYNKMKEKHTGFSVMNITEILEKCENFHRQYPRFTNKPLPKTVTSDRPGKRWQIDVVSMANSEVRYRNGTYKYILQIVDIYSRYMMPQPLQSKKSSEIAKVLENVILEHGAPSEIQCDNGKEFQGRSMRKVIEKFEIKLVHGRPYHPQSQGKCERSNRLLRQRISFACTNRNGFNWAEGLPIIAHEINTSVKAILGNITPFEAYHGRSHRGRDEGTSERDVRRRLKQAHKLARSNMKKKACQPSKYKKGERVLIRYPFFRSRVPKKRHILKGIVLKRSKNCSRYLIAYRKPQSNENAQNWVGVENITSVTIEKEKQKKNRDTVASKSSLPDNKLKKAHREKYYQVLSHEDNLGMVCHSDFMDEVSVLHDPRPDGNCQFEALTHQFSLKGIYRNNQTLRREAVDHLRRNRQFYESFVHDTTYGEYVEAMARDGTYGDNLTLVALMREYNMQCFVASTRGSMFSSLISNDGIFHSDLPLVTLLHFPENAGMHYVSVSVPRNVINELENSHVPEPELTLDGEPEMTTATMTASAEPETNSATVIDSSKTSELNTLRNMIMMKRSGLRKRQPGFAFFDLPLHIQAKITKMCLHDNPSFRFVLERADNRFRQLFQAIGYARPRLYISQSVMEHVPNVVSVRLLSRRAGRSSGLLNEIRKIIKHNKWANAWLSLRMCGIGWFEIVNIFYR